MLIPSSNAKSTDVLILGAGGAGLMCAIEAGRRGRRVCLIDHAQKLGGKILISGGGRCNFTNTGASHSNYVSENPHFCKSALSRYPASRFIEKVKEHGVAFHEKKLGQLFCDESARQIVDLLQMECNDVGAEITLATTLNKIERVSGSPAVRFRVETSRGEITTHSLVVATGGLSIPKIGATGIGYEIARQFGLKVVETAPALDGFVLADPETRPFCELSGISVDCVMTCNGKSFRENLLFTHSGLSGPASLQASLHWRPGDFIEIDLLPGFDSASWFQKLKKQANKSVMKNILSERLPSRVADRLCQSYLPIETSINQIPDKKLEAFSYLLHHWKIKPNGTVGYSKAEVTRGGVDTDELSSKTMEARRVPGLYFIGEVVDVTGWLGGYNFQWAWASGWCAGQVV